MINAETLEQIRDYFERGNVDEDRFLSNTDVKFEANDVIIRISDIDCQEMQWFKQAEKCDG